MLKCIPFNPDWADGSREDFRAIYRRRKQDNWGTPTLDASGREQWDLTGPLPMRQHNAWTRKGFVYVTLYTQMDDASWGKVAAWIRAVLQEDPMSYIQNRRDRSTFSADLYLKGMVQAQTEADRELRELVAQYGPEAVVAIKRQTNPQFQLPKELWPDQASEDEPVDDVVDIVPRKRGRPPKTRVEIVA